MNKCTKYQSSSTLRQHDNSWGK